MCALVAPLHLAMSRVRRHRGNGAIAGSLLLLALMHTSLALEGATTLASVGMLLLPASIMRASWTLFDAPLTTPRRVALVGLVLLSLPSAVLHVTTPEARAWWLAPALVPMLMALLAWVVQIVANRGHARGLMLGASVAMVGALGAVGIEAWVGEHTARAAAMLSGFALSPALLTTAVLVSRHLGLAEEGPSKPARYRRLMRLGAGGMGELWLASRSSQGGFRRFVALKRVRLDRPHEHMVERLITEAAVAARLHHNNIVGVHDLWRCRDGWYIVMEYLAGPSLWDVLHRCYEQRNFAPTSVVCALGVQVCRGLEYAHSHGVLHRDISPDNVIVTFDGSAKLLDFGIAKIDAETRTLPPMEDNGQHAPPCTEGRILGKRQYMAPERLLGEAATVQSDLFSLGLVMVQLLGAPLPPRGAELAGRKDPVSHYRPDVPAALEAIIARALAADPHRRFESAWEMEAALRAFASRLPSTDVGRWVRELCPDRWNKHVQLSSMAEPTPEQVEALLGERPPLPPVPAAVPERAPITPANPAPLPGFGRNGRVATALLSG